MKVPPVIVTRQQLYVLTCQTLQIRLATTQLLHQGEGENFMNNCREVQNAIKSVQFILDEVLFGKEHPLSIAKIIYVLFVRSKIKSLLALFDKHRFVQAEDMLKRLDNGIIRIFDEIYICIEYMRSVLDFFLEGDDDLLLKELKSLNELKSRLAIVVGLPEKCFKSNNENK